VKGRRVLWRLKMAGIDPAQLVFIDECGATTQLTRTRGRCPIGRRLIAPIPHGHWKVLTTIGALSLRGMVAAVTVDAPTDAEIFRRFVTDALVPALRPGQWVIMDNLQSHKAAGIQQAIEAAGARVLYLPPYSPDFNPIEPAWSKIKQYLRSIAARTVDGLGAAVGEAIRLINAADAEGFFGHCGYATSRRKTI
jgi:transposase